MKAVHFPVAKPTILAMLCASMLAACGGSGDNAASTPTTSTPAASASISGKAIDGYLVGATVCLDLNNNNACDSGEPSTTTDAKGDFKLPYDGDTGGKRLVVQVTPTTKDLSRPAGFTFPASYTLSAVLDGANTTQHVSPLTTLVTAQMEAGMSRGEAVRAVQTLLGSSIDPSADFVANGDAGSAAKAAAIVDTLTSLASGGKVDATAVRNILNAMIAKGDVAVTQTDVDAQAAKPMYALTDASKVLSQPVYSYIDALSSWLMQPTQAIQQIQDGKLQRAYQLRESNTGPWTDLPLSMGAGATDPTSLFAMKADGSWTGQLTAEQWRAPQPLTSVARTLAGTDPLTGIAFRYESRDADLSNQPASLALTGGMLGARSSFLSKTSSQLANIPLPAGTHAYLGIQSYDTDRVVLPMGLPMTNCQVPYVMGGGGCPISPSAAYVAGTAQNDTSLPSPLSISQLVGLTVIEPSIAQLRIQIAANNTATITLSNSLFGNVINPGEPQATAIGNVVVNATWSIYGRDSNVMVFDMSKDAAANVALYGYNAGVLAQGAKLVLAVRNGQLHSGLLFPAGYAERSVQFPNGIPSVMMPDAPA